MTKAAIWSLFIIATAAVIWGLVFFKDVFTQVTLAIILFLGVGGMARWFYQKIPGLPKLGAGLIAVAIIVTLLGVVMTGIVENVGAFRDQAGAYEARLNELVDHIFHGIGGHGPAPTVETMLSRVDAGEALTMIAAGFESIIGNGIFILIYLGFLLAAASRLPAKLNQLFTDPDERSHARAVITAIRESMEQYLWVQTVLSVITTVLTYATLQLLGLDHAMFWALLIFFLNYIPTVGSIIAVALPSLFALVQFPHVMPALFIALGISFWQFVIGNVLAPRMTGKSLNLSPLVVLLALAIWGSIWGITGAFLAAPLTVMIMIILAQFKPSRWIAILLSADGQPTVLAAQRGGETKADVSARLHSTKDAVPQ